MSNDTKTCEEVEVASLRVKSLDEAITRIHEVVQERYCYIHNCPSKWKFAGLLLPTFIAPEIVDEVLTDDEIEFYNVTTQVLIEAREEELEAKRRFAISAYPLAKAA